MNLSRGPANGSFLRSTYGFQKSAIPGLRFGGFAGAPQPRYIEQAGVIGCTLDSEA